MTERLPLDPRKRPRQRRAVATVDAICEAAARILEDHGADALNTNAVAERAGVSVGSLYQYFPGKEAILAELIARRGVALAERLELAAAIDDLDDALVAMVRVAVAQQSGRPRLARILDLAEERLPLDEPQRALQARIEGAVTTFLGRSGVPKDRIGVAALDLFGLARGMTDTAAAAGALEGLDGRITRAVKGYISDLIAR